MTKKVRKGEEFKKGDLVFWDEGNSCATSRNLGTVLIGNAESDSKDGQVKVKDKKELGTSS